MNKQENLTSENIAFLEKTIKDGTLSLKIVAPLVVAFIVFQFFVYIPYLDLIAFSCFIILGIGYFTTTQNQEKIQQDIKNGVKDITNGTITKKRVGKGGYYALYVNDVRYRTNYEQYNAFDMRDNVQIEATPIRKKLLKIVKA